MFGARGNREQAAGTVRPRSRRTVLLIAGAVALAALMIIAGGLAWLFASGRAGFLSASAAVRPHHARPAARPAPPLHVLRVTPADAARRVNGSRPVKITFSAPLAADSPMPGITPAVHGTWATAQGSTLVFTPAAAFRPDTTVTVRIPAGPSGVRSAAGGLLGAPVTGRFRTRPYSTLRLQQLMAQLGYLPMTWTPSSGSGPAPGDRAAQLSAAYHAPPGTFSWQGRWPAALTSLWTPGAGNLIDVGAIRAFESVHGLPMDGVAGPAVWRDLLRAVARGQVNLDGYSYALASKAARRR